MLAPKRPVVIATTLAGRGVGPRGRGPAVPASEGVAERTVSPGVALRWIVKLRWHAAGGQALVIGLAACVLRLELPLASLAALVALTALSNVALAVWLRREPVAGASLVASLLCLDALSLTALLALSGGASNPFATLYLVHIAVAAFVLERRWLLSVFTLCAAGYVALLLGVRGPAPGGEVARPHGTWAALGATGLAVALVVSRLSHALRERQDALARAQRAATRAETVASLGALAAGAAHELNTPLGTIALVSNELEFSIRDDPEQALADARLIRDEVERCRAIVQRMSVRAGGPAVEPASAATASAVLERVVEALSPAERARVVARAGADAPFALPLQALVQALTGLVQNALEASREGAGGVLLLSEMRDGRVRFVVDDEGPGMPPLLLDRLGEPFLTTKPPGKGTGLGIFLCSAFADACRGELRFESSPGRGTRATLELPVAPGPP
jgi:two-component system, sensor histidine kinase RegB